MKKVISRRFGTEVSQGHPFTVRATQQVATNYICDVFGVLESLSDIEDTLFALGIATEGDTVTIRLNSEGGQHRVGDTLIMAMRNCAVPVHIQASGIIASFATFVLLQADSFEISPFTDILCHSASFGYGGKMTETKEAIAYHYKQAEKVMRHYYEGFFTKEELDKIIGGYEHFMDVEEFVERFQKRNEYLAQLEEEECECGHCGADEPEEEQPPSPKPPYASRRKKQPAQAEE